MSQLFERFSSKENLKKAFLYLRDEANESSLPLDPIWRPTISAVANLGDKFFESLQNYLRNEKYNPDKASYIYADKDNMGVRPVCVFSVIDRIIFQALLNPWVLGDIIDKKLCNACFGNRIAGNELFLKIYKNQWAEFCDKQVEAYKKGLVWRVEFDIQTFYENIHIETLLETIREEFGVNDSNILGILEHQLRTWSETRTMCGIPQGPRASHILANAYLFPLDTLIDNQKGDGGFEFFRYADDIVIMAKDSDKINRIVSEIQLFVRKFNLKLNDKTRLEKLRDTKKIEELKFYNPYGEINETSKQKVEKIGKKLPSIFRKLKRGEDLLKTELSGLRYFLKAKGGIENSKLLDELIYLIPRKPSLVNLICQYIGYYFSGQNEIEEGEISYEKPTKELKEKYGKVWNIYVNNSLSEWAKFSLLKVLSAPLFAISHKGFRNEIDKIVISPKTKFLRPIAFFYKGYVRDFSLAEEAKKGHSLDKIELGFSLDDIKRQIRNSETESEKATYYYFSVYLKGYEDKDVIKNLVYEALTSESLEIQTIGIFLVEKLYRVPVPVLVKRHPHTLEGKNLKINMKHTDAWDIDLSEKNIASLVRLYFKLSPPTKPSSKIKDDFLTSEGKIAPNKLNQSFGIPIPLPVRIVKSTSEKKKTKSSTKLFLNQTGDLWRDPKEKYCYGMGEKSDRHKTVRYLFQNKGYSDTSVISSQFESKSKKSIRTEIGKLNKKITGSLKLKSKVIQGRKESGYRINPVYSISIKKE